MRELVKIRTIKELNPIPGADEIEVASVDGWEIVVRKGEFIIGDPAIMLEIDSVVPNDDARFAFLEKTKFRVKTIKLRKQISQGVLLPLSSLTPEEYERWQKGAQTEEGETLTEILRVHKYEPPVPIAGKQKRGFPTHLMPKTDQERLQNIPEVLMDQTWAAFEVTEKLDGTSCAVYCTLEFEDGTRDEYRYVGVCSRNWEMQLDDDNVYAKLFHELGLEDKLKKLGRNIAIQGEIIGPGIQGNKYKRSKQEFYVFDIWNIDAQRYFSHVERLELVQALDLQHVPIVDLQSQEPMTLESVLSAADGKSLINPQVIREGLVFKALDGSVSFKAISNIWLLRHDQ